MNMKNLVENVCPHCGKHFRTAQPWDHCPSCHRKFNEPAVQHRVYTPYPDNPCDFSSSGLGIGGINDYQPTAAEEMAQIDAMIAWQEREDKRVHTGPQGQLWQECEKWGCDNEPVCANCFYCEYHCRC